VELDKPITIQDVLSLVHGLLNFPYPRICRHAVASNLLSELEARGWKCPPELEEAVVRCQDDDAIAIIDRLVGEADGTGGPAGEVK
jgi:hypothetical protein